MDFLDSPKGQIIAGAHRYLSAARLLLNSAEFERRPNLLKIPTLHLIAHGIELLLKFPMLQAGRPVDEVRRKFGHDLNQLWDEPSNSSLRDLVIFSAIRAWSAAERSGKWSDNFSRFPEVEIVAQLRLLAPLHSKETDFALRYIAPPKTPAPRPAFLADTFGDVAERLLKNPQLLL
ncbi:MAG: hypothetical protein JNK47_10775 [Mesorhizobium sp.]|nr:hypothetical protein [Mesorhizobium sp.]MBL8577701.1 hypothetical protein [Mesorhizobium sp.]